MKLSKIELSKMFKEKAFKRDENGRVYYIVPTTVRRNSRMIVPDAIIKSILKEGQIDQQDIDNIRPY